MGARAIWKGTIRLGAAGKGGEEAVPVKLYSAVEDRNIHFRLLAPDSGGRIRQRMVEASGGAEVASEEIRRGFETEPGRYVILGEEELDELRPEPSRDIVVNRFVPLDQIDHRWYDRPYYLGPDEDAGGAVEDYFALAEALEEAGREGVAHWVMRNKAYVGSLHARDGYLMMMTLRRAGEVVDASGLEPPGGDEPTAKELKMAEQLVAAYEDDFDPSDFQDEYRKRVREMIEAKAAGSKVKVKKARPKEETRALEEALAASLKAAEGARNKKGSKQGSKNEKKGKKNG